MAGMAGMAAEHGREDWAATRPERHLSLLLSCYCILYNEYRLCRVQAMIAPRMTLQVQLVLQALLRVAEAERYGLELRDETGLPSGTIYPIIARLEQAGWLESRWEDPALHIAEGRPRRRYYRLTRDGAELARTAIARSHRSRAKPVPGWSLRAPGTHGAQA